MKAGKRLWTAIGVAALALAAAPARAQETPRPPADEPASEPIGPRELQNFSINGTVTREAEPPPAQRSATVPPATAPRTAAPSPMTRPSPGPADDTGAAPADQARGATTSPISGRPTDAPTIARQSRPSPSVTVPLPPLDGRISAPSPDFSPTPDSDAGNFAPRQLFSAWAWLLAVLALALGGLFLWRSRSRPAYAGGPQADAFVAPQPPAPRASQPAPEPAPLAPAPAPLPPRPLGVVSTRLRPRIELQFNPLSCTVDGEQVVVDFELELFNSGSAPARAVLIEASLFNAGQSQDQAIGAFFDNPVGKGERIVAIDPLKRFAVRSQVAAPRANVQLFKIEGREVFVPLIAFNALYRWSSGEGQSSSAYLVGRDNNSEKLAPLRADLGPRQYNGLGARALPKAVRA